MCFFNFKEIILKKKSTYDFKWIFLYKRLDSYFSVSGSSQESVIHNKYIQRNLCYCCFSVFINKKAVTDAQCAWLGRKFLSKLLKPIFHNLAILIWASYIEWVRHVNKHYLGDNGRIAKFVSKILFTSQISLLAYRNYLIDKGLLGAHRSWLRQKSFQPFKFHYSHVATILYKNALWFADRSWNRQISSRPVKFHCSHVTAILYIKQDCSG